MLVLLPWVRAHSPGAPKKKKKKNCVPVALGDEQPLHLDPPCGVVIDIQLLDGELVDVRHLASYRREDKTLS